VGVVPRRLARFGLFAFARSTLVRLARTALFRGGIVAEKRTGVQSIEKGGELGGREGPPQVGSQARCEEGRGPGWP